MNRFLSKILILLCILLWVIDVTAQEPLPSPAKQFENTTIESRKFEDTEWKKATKGIDYRNSTRDQKNVNEDVGDALGGKNATLEEKARNLGGATGAFWNIFVKITFVIFVFFIVGLLIYSLIKGENIFKQKKKVPKTTSFDLAAVETNLVAANLDQFIIQAENESNYPLAIRLHYLAIIKELSRKKIIRYKKNKTNHIYVAKVSATPFGDAFRQATHVFERIWFGQNLFTHKDYQQVKPDFQKWIDTAKNLDNEKSSLNLNTP